MTLRLRTFGTVSIEAEGGLLSGRCTQRRRLALLALLAAARDRGISRDKLLAYLWPERDTEHGRHALSQALYAIRQELGDAAVTAGLDDLRLDSAVVTSDVAEFEVALAAGRLEEAVGLYTGPFLDGFFVPDAPEFERWAEGERQRLAAAHAASLESLGRAATARGDHAGAIGFWRRRAANDLLDPRIALHLMRALADDGDRAAAIRHARVHAALLQQELEVGPNVAVQALADELRAADLASTDARVIPSRPRVEPVASLAPEPVIASDEELQPRTTDAAPEPLAAATLHPWRSRRSNRWTVGVFGAIALALASAAAIATRPSSDASTHADGSRLVVLGAITGPDDVLAGAVREALRAELEAAPDVRVVGESSMRETLHLMTLPTDTPITAPIAVEIAERRGAPLAIVGSVSPLGTGALLVVQLLETRSGLVLVTRVERPANDRAVIPSVTRLATALRASVTGSATAPMSPLPAANTASLPALRSYVLARQSVARMDVTGAIALGEAALVHDSVFALAHYLVGDLLWYVDRQRHSDLHMQRAYMLSATLPPRERLIVRARYQQLVGDQLDSALASWQLLAASYPDEPLAYEGMRWVHRARDEMLPMAVAAESAYRRDATSFRAFVEGRLTVLLEAGDSAGAVAFARSVGEVSPWAQHQTRLSLALRRDDLPGALNILDPRDAVRRQVVLLASGRFAEGSRELDRIRRTPRAQDLPRALLLQARAEQGPVRTSPRAKVLVREAIRWMSDADLSPPAYARLAERSADVAARARDTASIETVRRLIIAKDAGRGLSSYKRALMTIEACAAYARGDMQRAATVAARARPGMFYGRPVSAIVLLEADARMALGERATGERLYRELVTRGAFPDGDRELTIVLRPFATRALATLGATASR